MKRLTNEKPPTVKQQVLLFVYLSLNNSQVNSPFGKHAKCTHGKNKARL